MILNTQLSHEAEYLGDVQENRVGIDKSNLDFITTLLTSNLYSKPLESFFRETVANAHDSHVEAGTDEHILMLIQDTDNYGTYRVSIRDYGTGVSPERFDKIYKNVGSSTKRDSNDFIGMFGIGRFSCLACADVAHITSYYNGKKYSYVMYKNGGGINIDQLSVTEGDYKNGLEVSIEKSFTLSELSAALSGVCLFDKLYVSYKGNYSSFNVTIDEFNKRKITNFNTFSRCSYLYHTRNYFKVGKVLYGYSGDGLKTIAGIIIDLPIGSVDITPNREALQFTDFTNKTINAKIAEVKQEFQKMVNSHINGDITMSKLCNNFVLNDWYTVREKEEVISIDKEDVKVNLDSVTLDGEKIPKDYATFLRAAQYVGIEKDIVYKTISSYSFRLNTYNNSLRNLLIGRFNLIEKADKVTKQVTLKYTIEQNKLTSVILVCDGLNTFKSAIEKYMSGFRDPSDSFNVQECIDFTFRHIPIKVMSNDSVPQSYIDTYKEEQKGKRKKVNPSEIPVRVYYSYGYRRSSLNYIPNTGLVVYSSHVQDDTVLKEIAELCSDKFRVITVKAEHVKLFEGNRRFISIENFMFLKNPMLTKIVTAHIIKRNFSEMASKYNIGFAYLPIYSEFNAKYSAQINCLRYWANDTSAKIFKYYEEHGWVNQYDIAYFSLSEEEAKGRKGWEELTSRRRHIIRLMARKKYGRLPKIGLTSELAN